ncbi:MAG: type IV pilus twitching motility protein PilT [Gammaproteobacteria bacterium]
MDENYATAPQMPNLMELLEVAVKAQASDLHLSSGLEPIVRIDGDLLRIKDCPIYHEEHIKGLLKEVLPSEALSLKEHDFSFGIKELARFRVNVFHQAHGMSAVFRVLSNEIPKLEDLKMPDTLKKLCELPNGLVLVTGPTGSGKSTTLAAMIDYLNESVPKHILTLEDPIEFLHPSKQCLVQQRQIHEHTNSFNDALRAALREDPDVILVGEMRDLETIRLALTAAETGHLVFATLHTSSAPKTVNRVIDVFPAAEKNLIRSMLSESLQAVVSQVLLKKKGGGRIAAQEVLIGTPAVRNLIREDKVPQIISAMQTGQEFGMQTMENALAKLQADGLIE